MGEEAELEAGVGGDAVVDALQDLAVVEHGAVGVVLPHLRPRAAGGPHALVDLAAEAG